MSRTYHGDIGQRVNALAFAGRKGTVDDESVDVVGSRDVIGGARGRNTSTGLVDAVVLAVVGVGAHTGGDGIARVPVGREVGAGVVANAWLLHCVLGETRVLVDANSVALLAVVLLLGQVLGIGVSEDI